MSWLWMVWRGGYRVDREMSMVFFVVAFYSARRFNGDISQWDVSKVSNLFQSKHLVGDGRG